MRKALQRAELSTDLGWSRERQKDVDILTALGITDNFGRLESLGRKLITLKACGKSRSLMYVPGQDLYDQDQKEAIKELSDFCRFPRAFAWMRKIQRQRLCALVVCEWIHDQCDHCKGAGQITREVGGTITCGTCQGSGKRHYSDAERWEAIANVMPDKIEETADLFYEYTKAMTDMHGILGTAERVKIKATAEMLERW